MSDSGPPRLIVEGRRKPPNKALRGLLELAVTVAIAVLAVVIIQTVLVKPYKIPSSSMEPTLAIGQRVLVFRPDDRPGLGDIVVFHPPAGANGYPPRCGNLSEGAVGGSLALPEPCDLPTQKRSQQTFIKRVVGLPGDVLRIAGGHVIRNGVRERDPYIQPCGGGSTCTFRKTITVPPGMYYMMGDNRGISDDSRFWGPVPRKWIIGVAFFTYWPPDRVGSL